jgi:uncharacterized protein (TIGR02647 family)
MPPAVNRREMPGPPPEPFEQAPQIQGTMQRQNDRCKSGTLSIEKGAFPVLYTPEIVDELNVLVRYNLTTTQEGIKVHKNADPNVIEATRRLFHKGLVTHEDGGYLTALGRETAEQAQAVLDILTAD